MQNSTVIWIVIAVYAVAMCLIAYMNSRRVKNLSDFTVGGRNAGAWLSALSYGTSYFSAVMFIGYAGNTGWQFGGWAIFAGVGNAIFGSLLAWMVLANPTRKYTKKNNILSMPQFFEKRYLSKNMKLFSAIVIFIFLLPYSASVYKGLTSVCSVLLGIDEQVCMIVIAVASAILLLVGGYMAVLKADFIQGFVMMFGISALIFAIVRSQQVGGLTQGMTQLVSETKKLNLTSTNYLSLWSTVLMTSFGTWGLPHMIHKYYAIRDEKEVKRGTAISVFFALLVAGGGYFIGSLSHLFFTELPSPPNGGAGHPDYLIPNMMLQANISDILIGIILVLLISASVSTLTSVILTASSTVTMDIIKDRFKKDMSEKNTTIVTKVLCLIFIALSYLIANSNTPILDMMSYSWGIISGSFLAPYAIALYWKGLNKAGAWAGIIGGFLISIQPVVAKLFVNPETAYGKLQNYGPVFACAAMITSIILVFAVSIIANKMKLKSAERNDSFYLEAENA